MNFKFTYILLLLVLLFSCEENKYLSTENDFPLNVEKKTFIATSIKNLYRSPSLLSGQMMLGRYTFHDQDGRPIYRMYVRPIFSLTFNSSNYRIGSYDSNGDLIEYTDNYKFKGESIFKFRVDSLNLDSRFNSDFNNKVKLKVIKTPMFGDEGFLKEKEVLLNSRFSEFIDPSGERVHLLGETEDNVVSQAGSKSNYEIAVNENDIANLFAEYKDNENSTRYDLEGLMLDYDFQNDGVFTIDSLPSIVLSRQYEDENHILTDSLVYENVQMYQSHVWVNYERLIPESEEEYSLRYGDRTFLQLNFDAVEIKDFLTKNKIYGAQFKFKHNTVEEDRTTLYMSSVLTSFTSTDPSSNKYIDGLPLDSVLISNGSNMILNFDDSNSESIVKTNFTRDYFDRINDSYLYNWLLGNGEVGKVMIGNTLGNIGISKFPAIVPNDSAYKLIIYYSENIN